MSTHYVFRGSRAQEARAKAYMDQLAALGLAVPDSVATILRTAIDFGLAELERNLNGTMEGAHRETD